MAPTYTPLHRDPNPNLFVQLAGSKRVRLLEPAAGDAIYERVKLEVGQEGKEGSKAFRGEEMMKGKESEVLEKAVWFGEQGDGVEGGFETEVRAGDGLFIPQGWWHSIKGIGKGVTGSVNWWFR